MLICPQRFGGTLTAVQAAEAIATGWRSRAPEDELMVAPISGGGADFLDVLSTAADGGITVGATVKDPLGREVPGVVLVVEEDSGLTAYVEAAQAAGLHLLSAAERRPGTTTSRGVGELIEVALAEGATRVVVAVGDLATNDGGAGLLNALGVGSPEDLCRGGAGLAEIGKDALEGLSALRERLSGVELVLATQEELPLLGLQGTSAATAGSRGADPQEAQILEHALSRFRHLADTVCPPPTDLLSGTPRRVDRMPGAGAGGGLGYALLLLGARRRSAADWCFEAWDFPALLAHTDVVVTGEGCLDWRSAGQGVVAEVAELAGRHGLPVVAVAGTVEVGRRDTMTMGLSATYAIAERPAEVVAAMADPAGSLSARVARVAATWSPR